MPHEPQFELLVVRFVSQPSLTFKLQFPNPALQAAIVQDPPEQAGTALASEH